MNESVHPRKGFHKRSLDITVALSSLILLAGLMLLVAVAIRLDSPGPIVFRQLRLGRGGRPFTILKFRSMDVGAESVTTSHEGVGDAGDPVYLRPSHDPCVTRVGRFLRRTSLDELPQLINVLRGEMSMVGPRPLSLHDSSLLAKLDPDGFRTRLMVMPGITGLAQVSGRRALTAQAILDLDRHYVERGTLADDLSILLRTPGVVLGGKGVA